MVIRAVVLPLPHLLLLLLPLPLPPPLPLPLTHPLLMPPTLLQNPPRVCLKKCLKNCLAGLLGLAAFRQTHHDQQLHHSHHRWSPAKKKLLHHPHPPPTTPNPPPYPGAFARPPASKAMQSCLIAATQNPTAPASHLLLDKLQSSHPSSLISTTEWTLKATIPLVARTTRIWPDSKKSTTSPQEEAVAALLPSLNMSIQHCLERKPSMGHPSAERSLQSTVHPFKGLS